MSTLLSDTVSWDQSFKDARDQTEQLKSSSLLKEKNEVILLLKTITKLLPLEARRTAERIIEFRS